VFYVKKTCRLLSREGKKIGLLTVRQPEVKVANASPPSSTERIGLLSLLSDIPLL